MSTWAWCSIESGGGWADVRFTRDWKRVRCLDPDADVEMLEGLEREIKERMLEGASSQEWLLKRMEDTFSNAIRLTPAKAVLADSPQEEMGRLAEMYLERAKTAERAVRAAGCRSSRRCGGSSSGRGCGRLMRHNIAASEYTHRGDPLKIDAAYRPNGTVHMYQALSLEADVNAAKVLAFSYPKLREGVMRAEQAETALTAIVESELDREDDETMFALETLAAQPDHGGDDGGAAEDCGERAAEDGVAVEAGERVIEVEGLLPTLAPKGLAQRWGTQLRLKDKYTGFKRGRFGVLFLLARGRYPARGSK